MVSGYIGCAPFKWIVSPFWNESMDRPGQVGEQLGVRQSPLKPLWDPYYYSAERCMACKAVVFRYPNVNSSEGAEE